MTAPFLFRLVTCLICLGSISLLGGCSEGDTSLLNPGTNRDGLGSPPDTLDGITASADRSYRPALASGSSSLLLLSRQGQMVSTVYLRFDLDDLPDAEVVTGAQLGLRIGGGEGGPVSFAASLLDPGAPDWNEDEIPKDMETYELPPFFESIEGIEPPVDTTIFVRDAIEIPAEIIRDWKNDPEGNRGLAIRVQLSSPEGVLELLSKEATLDTTAIDLANPALEIFRSGEISVIEEPSEDAYLLIDSGPSESGADSTLFLEERVPSRVLLRFGLEDLSLRPGDTVNRARLHLRVVPGSVEESDTFDVGLYRADAEWFEESEPDTVTRGSLSFDIERITSETDSVAFDLGPLVQEWVEGIDDGDPTNYGLILRILTEGRGVDRGRFYSRESSGSRVPRLEIVFTMPPGPRWEGPTGGAK